MRTIHVALFKWKPGVKPEQIERVLAEVRALKDKISGIEAIYCGADTSNRTPGFTHAIVAVFGTPDAAAAYNEHPDHQKVAHEIDDIMADRIVGVDFSG